MRIEKIRMDPLPEFLTALMNQKWSVTGALAELIDNSFGQARGDATHVEVKWNARDRTFTVADNGKGMNELMLLFRLGRTIGMSPKDIGRYGAGGTMALLWLASDVDLFTTHGGESGEVSVNWRDYIRRSAKAGELLELKGEWKKEHRGERGTAIVLKLKPERRGIKVSNIMRDISRLYGPALRNGKRITWINVDSKGNEVSTPLTDEQVELTDPIHMTGVVEATNDEDEVVHLPFEAMFGRDFTVGISDSSASVAFGSRVILSTRDCYQSPDGLTAYQGVGVRGWIDLGEGWQRGFLSTQKDAVHDQRAWQALMTAIAVKIQPLLIAAEKEKRRIFLENLALNLAANFNGILQNKGYGRGVVDSDGTSIVLGPGEGSGINPDPSPHEDTEERAHEQEDGDKKTRTREPITTTLEFTESDDAACKYELVHMERAGNAILTFVNVDHPAVQLALEEKPINMLMLATLITTCLAWNMALRWDDLVELAFGKKTAAEVMASGDAARRVAILQRNLIDRVSGMKNKANKKAS